MEETAPAPRSGFSIWRSVPWILILLTMGGIAYFQVTAIDDDFAKANLISALLTTLTWMLLVAGLYLGNFPRSIWKVVFWVPVLSLVTLVALFRFDGLDGELVPQLTPRWAPEVKLPEIAKETDPIDTAFELRPTDFPQYLGPNRNGVFVGTDLRFDWSKNAPEIAWKQPIGKGWSGFAVQGDIAVTMEQRDETELVSAYSVVDGSLIWTYEIQAFHTNVAGGTGPRCTPTVWNNKVYASSAVSEFVCLDFLTGEKIWSQELLEMSSISQTDFESGVSWGRAGSPLIVADNVLIPFGGTSDSANLIAFNAETGEEAWRAGKGQVSYSSPTLYDVKGEEQILLFAEAQLVGYAPEDGQVLWSFDWPAHSNADPAVSQPVQVAPDQFFISKGYGTGSKLIQLTQTDSAWSVSEIWKNPRVLRTKFTNCVYFEDHVYGLSDGILECVHVGDGKRVWKKGRYRHGQLLLVDGHLLISAESGELVVVKATPESFQELSKISVIGDVTWNPLTLSGNRVLMRNGSEAACVLLPTIDSSGDSLPQGEGDAGE